MYIGSPRRGESFCSTGWKPQSGDHPVLREKKFRTPEGVRPFAERFAVKNRDSMPDILTETLLHAGINETNTIQRRTQGA